MELKFVVDSHSWESKSGQVPEYKVSLKNSEVHKLVLVGNCRAICEKFPKDEVFTLKIGRTQTTLDEVPKG